MSRPFHTLHMAGSPYFLQGEKQLSVQDIYEQHWEELLSLAALITRDRELAHDLAQDVFVSFLKNYEGKQIENVSVYLRQAMKFHCFKWIRSSKVAQEYLVRMHKPAAQNTTEHDVDFSFMQEKVEAIVAGMPPRAREVFMLSKFENVPNDEIASRLKISKDTVENHLVRALKILRASLKVISVTLLSIF